MIKSVIEDLKRDENYHGQFAYIREIKDNVAQKVEFPEGIDKRLKSNLEKSGITSLYPHQIKAYEKIKSLENVIIATSTSSGKTLSFALPIIEDLLNNEQHMALFLYPTKALTLDQYEKFSILTKGLPVNFGIYDGDTLSEERTYLRRTARVIFSNPDILHVGILPNHMNWGRFFTNLKYVVIDEAHYYSGVLGSHLSEILRRLRRVSNYYGTFPQFILSSATLRNPEEYSFKLVGERFSLITEDSSFLNKKYFIIFNPELVHSELNLRKSIYKESVWLIKRLIRNNLKTIVFVKSRKGVELLTRMLNHSLEPEERHFVSSYRAGYTKETRHEIERKLKNNELKAILTTNALELGIDIGDLDATIIVGYPGSLSSLYQQSGRSGRKKDSITIFIADSDALDQYIVNNPDFIFSNNFDMLEINNENPYILSPHLRCAAYELPIDLTIDVDYFGNETVKHVESMEKDGLIVKKAGKYFYAERLSYAPKVNIRSTGEENVKLIDKDGNTIEKISWKRAIEEAFVGAVYMHLARTYIVEKLDLENKFALLVEKDTEYYTDSLAIESIEILDTLSEKGFNDFKIYYGDVLVTEIVRGFVKKQFISDRRLGVEPLELPKITFYSKAFWFNLEEKYVRLLKEKNEDLMGTIHAMEHLLIGVMGAIVVCDRKDVGGVSHPIHPDTGKPTIFVYDSVEGGIGITEKAFEKIPELFDVAYKSISSCPCKEGCPSCIYSPKCGNENKPLSKKGAIIILKEFTS